MCDKVVLLIVRAARKICFITPDVISLETASYPSLFALSEWPEEALEPSTIARGVLGEFSRQAWQVTSHPKSPRTTGNEAALGN